jgi:hypothetical protein
VARLLADRGHEVRLLVGQAGEPGAVEVEAEAEAAVGPAIEVQAVALRTSVAARAGWWAARRGWRYRPDLPFQLATGAGLDELAATRAWARALRREEAAWAPDVTYVRGAGLDLAPVLARSGWHGPWLAHLHDPWPLSWYPPRYAERSRLVSPRQEARAVRLLREVPVLTVPSAELVSWMAARAGVDPGGRVHVVRHLGLPPPAAPRPPEGPWPDRPFVVGHVGALLGPRDPATLLEGWRRFVDHEPDAAGRAGLALRGSIDRRHGDGGHWAEDGVVVGRGRVPSDEARDLVAAADLGIVLESPDPVSPFLPAKVADLLAAQKPVLALTRAASPTGSLLGADHPLRVDPDDAGAVAGALAEAWRRWQDGSLGTFRPPAAAVAQVCEPAVGSALDVALEAAVSAAGSG